MGLYNSDNNIDADDNNIDLLQKACSAAGTLDTRMFVRTESSHRPMISLFWPQ